MQQACHEFYKPINDWLYSWCRLFSSQSHARARRFRATVSAATLARCSLLQPREAVSSSALTPYSEFASSAELAAATLQRTSDQLHAARQRSSVADSADTLLSSVPSTPPPVHVIVTRVVLDSDDESQDKVHEQHAGGDWVASIAFILNHDIYVSLHSRVAFKC